MLVRWHTVPPPAPPSTLLEPLHTQDTPSHSLMFCFPQVAFFPPQSAEPFLGLVLQQTTNYNASFPEQLTFLTL